MFSTDSADERTMLPIVSSCFQPAKELAMTSFKFITTSICTMLVVGCTQHSQISAEGQRFVLADEPAGAQGILDYRESKPAAGDVSLIAETEARAWSALRSPGVASSSRS